MEKIAIFALMKIRPIDWTIHGFALLHVLVNITCTLAGIPDSIFLTALTMAMAIVICYRENLTVEITVTALILVNILGFLLGNTGARVIDDILPPLWQHAFATFAVTEIMGWTLFAFAHRVNPSGAAGYEREESWYQNAGWLVICIALVFGIRVYINNHLPANFLIENSGATLVLVLTAVVSLLFMLNFALQQQREVSKQRTRRHEAEFRYMTLKHQVSPHFLFNSLNVLDSIVHDGTREEASDYLQKMAALYRYIMKNEGKRLVPLADEIDFARTYQQLMQIRFPECLVFNDLVGPVPPEGWIVPCTLQLLVENAVKHNAVSAQNPLVITASTDGKSISVQNNLIHKLTPVANHTGIGLQYIRNQYRDIAGEEIEVLKTADSFSVTIPIIQESEDFFVPLHRKN
ncbi:MAG: histidine kinase [Bacteroidales bacterium]|nr:histidine kinase [Bacteroidales bacterium]